ncbi:MAG: hypothetical protein A2504_08420 [Bdellovibrionales bacterium RIFOXYD12_FULL_39_22]|nr:MAG: hypothetical protein A2385_01645 [Bdellovibrionales bacterium RIFOXYB1_FULL_39_21]OFZ42851.1 MAG: hypothetical protein A2485_10725 [Bdellovibrionales bacterium RIFOXYC12_FULL_39_17]OFZ47489.1 MAG: hypothetical protein A2404_14565 [Bdellovibrionales bacterium RIFOXYC1_FULL_39_130]OFZ75577.1 MAG: hypothetical protein A2560_14715 [Bdellovibrionales bacterium RIFOXYD1_FULL_39_84]OFZ93900.1 MAG: hypothetical protein A2504_08420 [Bdellovibrionales bacterium RIFOXYD12_FULL_39_22]HLE10094.1 hy
MAALEADFEFEYSPEDADIDVGLIEKVDPPVASKVERPEVAVATDALDAMNVSESSDVKEVVTPVEMEEVAAVKPLVHPITGGNIAAIGSANKVKKVVSTPAASRPQINQVSQPLPIRQTVAATSGLQSQSQSQSQSQQRPRPTAQRPATKSGSGSADVEMQIKLAVIEAKAEIMAIYFAEAKLLEYQINELLRPFIVNRPLERPIRRIAHLLAEHAKLKK